jgi:hypothetical protein
MEVKARGVIGRKSKGTEEGNWEGKDGDGRDVKNATDEQDRNKKEQKLEASLYVTKQGLRMTEKEGKVKAKEGMVKNAEDRLGNRRKQKRRVGLRRIWEVKGRQERQLMEEGREMEM